MIIKALFTYSSSLCVINIVGHSKKTSNCNAISFACMFMNNHINERKCNCNDVTVIKEGLFTFDGKLCSICDREVLSMMRFMYNFRKELGFNDFKFVI